MTIHDYSQHIATIIERYGVSCASSDAVLSWFLRKDAMRSVPGDDHVRYCRSLLERGVYWDCEEWGFEADHCGNGERVQTALFSDRAVVIVEPHPDDAVLTFGALIQSFVAAGQDVYVLTGVSGWHAVSDDLVSRLPAECGDQLRRRYQALLMRYMTVISCDVLTSAAQEMVKGAIRVCDESAAAFEQLVPGRDVAHIRAVPLLLPFYDLSAVYENAQDDAVNSARAREGILEIMRMSGKRSLAVFFERGHDPRGTHRKVDQYVRTACDQLVRTQEIAGYIAGVGCGAWSACAPHVGVSLVPMDRTMMERKIRAFLAHRSQVSALVRGDDPLPFHERMLIQNRRNAVIAQCAEPYAEVVEWI